MLTATGTRDLVVFAYQTRMELAARAKTGVAVVKGTENAVAT